MNSPSRLGRVPVRGDVLRHFCGCEVNARDRIPMEFIVVPLDAFEVLEEADDVLIIRPRTTQEGPENET